jgi:hypothetical protein
VTCVLGAQRIAHSTGCTSVGFAAERRLQP